MVMEMGEEFVGVVDGYFSKVEVAAIKLESYVRIGDKLHFKGHTTDFTQTVESIQINRKDVGEAGPGDEVGIKVIEKVRGGDKVFKIKE